MDRQLEDAVLFVHGLQHSFCHIEALAAGALAPHRVIIVDLLGYGTNAEAPPDKQSVSANADYLEEVLQLNRCRRVHVVAHSMGGAVAVLFAERHPERVASFINVEGNFTLKDAFWSKSLAAMSIEDIRAMVDRDRGDPVGWLRRLEIEVTPYRLEVADCIQRMQSAETLKRMAQSLIQTTAPAMYLDVVRAVLEAGIPMHLVAGENSRDAWDVPDFVSRTVASITIQPKTGHMMMVEDPSAFLEIINGVLIGSTA